MTFAVCAIVSLLLAASLTFMSFKMFQMFQQSSYKVTGVLNWIKITRGDWPIRYFACAFFSFVSMLVFVACFGSFKYVKYIGLLFFALFTVLFVVFTIFKPSKKPLVITARVSRFITVSFLLFAGALFGLFMVGSRLKISYSIVGILPLFIPFIVMLAHFILLPFEILNNLGYRNRAIKKLTANSGLIKIGITGSFGKTTAKNIVAAMLAKNYKVCFSPDSYNTPMGISKVVNNQLADDDQIFIAEMGARNKGDIAELATIVNPNYGIITAIGDQHLETFGTRQNIIDTKFELIDNLAAGGLAVFNGDSPDAIGMYNRAVSDKQLTGAEGVEGAAAFYKDVKVSSDGTSFTLVLGEHEIGIVTQLLGRHIPSLITVCAVVAYKLGVSGEQIAAAMQELEQVPHRLELIRRGDTVIIDDAYNSNPEGAKNALLLLKEFDMTKIIITPGIVELGEKEQEANTTLGEQIAACADYCYLLGSRAAYIKTGALKGGMGEDKIFIVAALDEAVNLQQSIAGKKVILFENDLPDNF